MPCRVPNLWPYSPQTNEIADLVPTGSICKTPQTGPVWVTADAVLPQSPTTASTLYQLQTSQCGQSPALLETGAATGNTANSPMHLKERLAEILLFLIPVSVIAIITYDIYQFTSPTDDTFLLQDSPSKQVRPDLGAK